MYSWSIAWKKDSTWPSHIVTNEANLFHSSPNWNRLTIFTTNKVSGKNKADKMVRQIEHKFFLASFVRTSLMKSASPER